MSEIKINEMIKELRVDKGISQETLADVCDVSMQAVSKWENGQSCPDITLLPLLSEYFGVSVDYLLTGRKHPLEKTGTGIHPDLAQQEMEEDILYIVQCRNGKIIDKEQWNQERLENRNDAIRIRFDDQIQQMNTELHVEIWGDANIEAPDTHMNLNTGGTVNCGTVQGNICAGANVTCDIVEGNVSAGGNLNCTTIEGNTSSGGSINCTTIEGNVSAGCSISCETIRGDAKAGTKIEYKNYPS